MEMTLKLSRCVELGSQIVEANGGHHVLSPYVVEFRGDLPCDVDLIGEIQGGLAVCTSVLFRQAEGKDPISAETIRALPFAELERHASVMAAGNDDEDRELGKRTFEKQAAIAAAVRHRKHRITTALLTEVADIYKNATDWPTKAVADQKGVSRSTAATWVGLARKHKPPLLPPAEASPTKKGSKS